MPQLDAMLFKVTIEWLGPMYLLLFIIIEENLKKLSASEFFSFNLKKLSIYIFLIRTINFNKRMALFGLIK